VFGKQIENDMKRVLITGASSGIGLATAKEFVKHGSKVTGLGRDFSDCDCPEIDQISIDLSDLDGLVGRLKSETFAADSYDCLVLNAGYGRFGGIEQFSYVQIRHLIDTNLVSNLYLLKHFLAEFKRSGGKDIVLIGSESALSGAKQGAVYCASKFAIRGLAQSLRADCAQADVRVILINPGAVASDFFEDLHFEPVAGAEFSLNCDTIADAIMNALSQPRTAVIEEINIQPMKRAFTKK
jgi:NADP-dependent 3-hydroxy acid dehydrogenase YdfG